VGTRHHEQVSTTDPDSTYATKGGTPARLGYYDNYLVDNHSCVIVGVQATAARMSQETVAAQDMLARFAQWQGREPESVAADTTYGNGEFLHWLADRSITPYIRTRDSIHRKNSPFYGPERFRYQPESNSYICPAGQQLNYGGRNQRNRTYAYIGTRKRCGACALKAQCTSGAFRFLAIPMDEPARQRARELANTPEFAQAQRERKKVEARTQESDRIASPAFAQIEVCAGAVLPGGSRPEHQATRAVPQPTNHTCSGGHFLVKSDKNNNVAQPLAAKKTLC
jgi:hypothetical protein